MTDEIVLGRSPLGGPRISRVPASDAGSGLEEWSGDRVDAAVEEHKRAQAVADGEPEVEEIRTDGGDSHAARIAEQLAMADAEDDVPELHVGDHVSPIGRDATTVVVRVCDEAAGDYWIDVAGETVAEYNDCDPTEDVYQVVFADRDDGDLMELTRYPYPRSALELVEPVHERGAE